MTLIQKEDLREYSDQELSMRVFNDEGLYLMRKNRSYLLEVLNDLFIYTSEQLEDLENDLDIDEKGEQ